MKKIIIYGASGFGKEVEFLIKEINKKNNKWEIVGYIDDDLTKVGREFGHSIILGDFNWLMNLDEKIAVSLAIGDPKIRKIIYEKIVVKDNLYFPSLISPDLVFDQKKVKYLLGAFALIGVFSMPYGYYTFLRITVTMGCIFLIIVGEHDQSRIQNLVLIVIAILFNPVIPIYLARDLWKFIDLFISLIFFGSALFGKDATVE